MGVVVGYTITMNVDNVGDIFIQENAFVYLWTNHTGLRLDFIRYYVGDKTIKTKIFRSKENIAYLFTNNLSNKSFYLLTTGYTHHARLFKNNYQYINYPKTKCTT